eukprot:Hpha_TRINITY_DN15011_c3_g4::TRINITY_DN15011_c3_g4_i1::g.126399::m.126399/K05857/PLCD; phosphatidylinositol phospholipase C, delta
MRDSQQPLLAGGDWSTPTPAQRPATGGRGSVHAARGQSTPEQTWPKPTPGRRSPQVAGRGGRSKVTWQFGGTREGKADIAQLQGPWQTSSGQNAVVSGNSVKFSLLDGTFIPPVRTLETGSGEILLLGCKIAHFSAEPREVKWSDGDTWRKPHQSPKQSQSGLGSTRPGNIRPGNVRAMARKFDQPRASFSPGENTLAVPKDVPQDRPGLGVEKKSSFRAPVMEMIKADKAAAAGPSSERSVRFAGPEDTFPAGREETGNSQTGGLLRRMSTGLGSGLRRKNSEPNPGMGRHMSMGGRQGFGREDSIHALKGEETVCCFCIPRKRSGVSKNNPNADRLARKVETVVRSLGDRGAKKDQVIYMMYAFERTKEAQGLDADQRWDALIGGCKDNAVLKEFAQTSARQGSLPPLCRSGVSEVRVLEQWWAADDDASGTLDFKEVGQLMHLLNFNIRPRELEKRLKNFDVDGNKQLDYEEFRRFNNSMLDRDELRELHAATFQGVIGLKGVQKFLRQQGDPIDQAEDIFRDFADEEDSNTWSLRTFSQYVTSSQNNWARIPGKPWQDMRQPITSYFCSSSHNTYLTDHQLYGESKAEMYGYCLRRGCKCLELDCWDGQDGEPVVTHGHTKTTKVSFEKCIEEIDKHAFHVSDYPVILSIELHTSPDQQIRMAQIMRKHFGHKLHESIAFTSIRHTDPGYSLEGLKGKILVKGPMLEPSGSDMVDDDDKEDVMDQSVSGKDSLGSTKGLGDTKKDAKPAEKKKLTGELSGCVWMKNTKLRSGGPADHAREGKPWEVTSIAETKGEKLFKSAKDAEALAAMNRVAFTRLYPKGTRMDSSNLHPAPFWGVGCQIVALNWQTADYPVRLNAAFFKYNGNCGYVLKPKSLREPGGTGSSVEGAKKREGATV